MHITRSLRLALIVSLVVSLGAACSAGSTGAPAAADDSPVEVPPSTTAAAPVRPTADLDELVAVGSTGARMHLTCTGSGPSTVVFMSGFGDQGDSWGDVSPAVTDEARVCTYARFGLGTSDAPPSPQTFTTWADDLHELLQAAGEPGPYVVVGHSFGGPEAVTFTDHYADEVDGVLLIDASPVDWPTAACAVRDTAVTAGSWRDVCATYAPAHNPEHLDVLRAFADVGTVDSLGEVPMAVMTRAQVEYAGLAARTQRQLQRVWNEGQDHWMSLTSSATFVPVDDTSHYIQIDQPARVIEQLRALLP
jgi:pimeloyl-ACP methyl ester carboxylesterase